MEEGKLSNAINAKLQQLLVPLQKHSPTVPDPAETLNQATPTLVKAL